MSILLPVISGCNQEQPVSYKIPKEVRETKTPNIADKESPTQMQLLPGMQEAAENSPKINYEVPDSWEEVPPSGIRKANFKITGDLGSAEITVLTFPGDVGGQLANINRWRSQIGLNKVAPENVGNFTERIEVAGHQGLYVRLKGETQSILGILLPFHGDTWFFKMAGDTAVVFANETKLKQFLNSIEFEEHTHKER